jgi:cell volume regulation protein A
MTTAVIVSLCTILLIAYAFDLTSAKTRIPSVILLLVTGYVVRRISESFEIRIPNLDPLLPIFGTVGLILIVLEGALELELDKSKLPLIGKSMLVALMPMLLLAFGLAWAINYFEGINMRTSLINAIPLAVISSAIAIPSTKNLPGAHKEFIVYESSLSDILGVLMFNFVSMNESYGLASVGHFSAELLEIAIISAIATVLLALMMRSINHHIKYAPIILMIILIYAISKEYHLPALLFILLFGLALGNLDELKRFRWVRFLQPERLNANVHKFRELTVEATFIIRALFFLIFGYLIHSSEILNLETLAWSVGIVAGIFLLRAIFIALAKLPIVPLLFIAPRGLITILLFLSIPVGQSVGIVNRSMLIQVIILSALVMMFGMMTVKPAPAPVPPSDGTPFPEIPEHEATKGNIGV